MNIEVDGESLVIELKEDLTASVVRDNLDRAKDSIEDNGQFSSVVLDISNVKSIDSIGVTFVVGLFKTSTDNDKSFQVVGASDDIANLFSIMKLDEVFTVQ